ncbi:uncharacterized protein LOC100373153 [Saccoglossus kowalevskii]|uniref:Uncharacterized protein LOC100373153 n=1 Tax=Saccoglossus kowalevskii TaxID=10224 RepID=A0ABM0LVS0_SACKO|nr:PREDICTED: uncharacterized protein LOC100373153 [Saccoglossus kowalevskii]
MKNFVTPSIPNLPHLRGLKLAQPVSSIDSFTVSLLIGADFYWDFVEDHVIRGPGPTAVSSKFGYLLSGPIHQGISSETNTTTLHVMTHVYEEESKLQSYWDLETIGIKDDSSKSDINVDNFEIFRDTHLRVENGKYIAWLPWKRDHPPLPTNYDITEKRTRAMVRKLTPELLQTYDKIINDQKCRNFIEEVKDDDNTRGHYLPHHSVKKDSITTPTCIRVVYDCSCKSCDSQSLNDCLETGPSLLNDLTSILLRFCVNRFALTSDIEKAFLQVGLENDDHEFTKFMLLMGPSDPESPFTIYRFKVILFGAVSSPFILNAVVKTHLENNLDSSTADDLRENIYVDIIVTGTDNTIGASAYYNDATQLMNSSRKDNALDSNSTVNVLGICWLTESDQLTYTKKVGSPQPVSLTIKREVVRTTAVLYDPLGYLSPVHIKAKLFVQDLWKRKLAWDDPVDENTHKQWFVIVEDLNEIRNTKIKRQYFNDDGTINSHIHDNKNVELPVFADANSKAYGAVAYLRRHDNQTSLVMSKTRVAPIKELTIPRLELMAALIASRLMKFVFNALKDKLNITSCTLWSDSQIVLHWIGSNKKLPTFVANRVKEINQFPCNFNYCPTTDNPADMISRGIHVSARKLENCDLWWNGPPWLSQGDWPISDLYDSAVHHISTADTSEGELEHTPQSDTPTETGIQHMVDAIRYSSQNKLLRVTALVLRFISNTRHRNQTLKNGYLTAEEIQRAEHVWIKDIQQAAFYEPIKSLQHQQTKSGWLVKQLKLFIDERGLLHCGGRLHNAPLRTDTKFPILLPNNHRYTDLLILNAHASVLHARVQSTVTHIRQRYWIAKIRRVVGRLLHSCVTCRKVSGKPYQTPLQAPLQSCRVNITPPFTVTGVDFTGALHVKSPETAKKTKSYVCLFTCAVTRAVHLELMPNLSTQSFLLAFCRFVARRSLPGKLISDNASTAANELNQLFDSPDVKQYLANKRIHWHFIPKRAPWYGGFWERLIGMTKNAIKKVLGRSYVSFEELRTVLTEIETTLNDRLITYVSSDIDDATLLTPSHLLHGRQMTILPHPEISDDELNDPTFSNHDDVNKRCAHLARLLAHFWKRWTAEYLPALPENHKLTGKTDNIIKVGDVVLVHNDIDHRIKWPIAVVEELVYGRDKLVRSAFIRTNNGRTNRSINKLYPLEMNADVTTMDIPRVNIDTTHLDLPADPRPSGNTIEPRPKRTAAVVARYRISDMNQV